MFIDLSNTNLKCEIDNADWPLVRDYTWRLKESRYVSYACASKGKKTIRMQRLIMQPKDTEEIHHIDRNTLNNKRENLLIVTRKQHKIIHSKDYP